jgi:glycosyltransferase involved in cell wall biosynthesis
MRIAIVYGGRQAVPQRDTGEAIDGSKPRTHLFDEMFSQVYDERVLEKAPRHLRTLYSLLPLWMQIAFEVHRRRGEYDVIVSWGLVSVGLMAIQHFVRRPKPHIAMMYWFSKPNIRLPLRLFGGKLHGIVTWSSIQRNYAIEKLGIPPAKIRLVKHFVDQAFWSPQTREADMICSAGKEMRDYPTLMKALGGTGLRCHIAADSVLMIRSGIRSSTRESIEKLASGKNDLVTIGTVPLKELKDLYARSRFVIVPLMASDTDSGVTVVLEAMAMGKPVICSRTKGQVDVIEDGVTGFYVPVGDAIALRNAMLALWNEPDRARAMGARARAYVEQQHTLEMFCEQVKSAIEASVSNHQVVS